MSAFFWDDLLEYIDEKRVIPILGPELLRVPQEGGERQHHVAIIVDHENAQPARTLGSPAPVTRVGGCSSGHLGDNARPSPVADEVATFRDKASSYSDTEADCRNGATLLRRDCR